MKELSVFILFLVLSTLPCIADGVNFASPNDSITSDTLRTSARMATRSGEPYSIHMPEFPYKSPEAAAFERYGQYEVGEYTGIPDINFPLYKLRHHDIDIPITLTYDASGIRVGQEATWVGLGWNLNAGGCITLVPAGQVDYTASMGDWLDYDSTYDVRNSPSKSSNLKSYNDSDYFDFYNGYIPWNYPNSSNYYKPMLEDLHNGQGERDIFSANFMGKHFLFFYNPYTCSFEIIGRVSEKFSVRAGGIVDGEVLNQGHNLSVNDITQGFTIKDAEGFTYKFATAEKTHENGRDYTSAWLLTTLTSPNGNTAYFTYGSPQNVSVIGKLSEQYLFLTPADYGSNEYLSYGISSLQTGYFREYTGGPLYVSKPYLKSISTDNATVTFCSSPGRIDLPGSVRLDSVSTRDRRTGRRLASWNFSYSYFKGCNVGGDYTQTGTRNMPHDEDFATTDDSRKRLRLRLDAITNVLDNKSPLTTTFTYDGTALPLKTSFATDFWGYYNGKENRNTNEHKQPTGLPSPTLRRYTSAATFTRVTTRSADSPVLTGSLAEDSLPLAR